MTEAHLQVHDAAGDRTIPIVNSPFTIGRRETNDLRLNGSEVSREHAEIVLDGERMMLRDRESRYGTFVNGEQISEREVRVGDRIRLGRGGGADLVLAEGAPQSESAPRSAVSAVGDFRQIAALLEGLRALGSGRVLQDVLALVLDSAIEVSGAERGFIMLAAADDTLEFKLARGRGKTPLNDATFATSRKIPEEVFRTGELKLLADLLDTDLAGVHEVTVALGIRNVVCAPLKLVRYIESGDALAEDRRIGVLYLDSREKGVLLSQTTRSGIETLAAEAAVAIENARLYRETIEKAKLEQEMRIAAEIQQALLPKPLVNRAYVEAAASSTPCRSIGGDFFDYADLPEAAFGFTLGDVAGKGPPAALLSALLQGMFGAQAAEAPAVAVDIMNKALCRRGIESRFVTLLFGSLAPDGVLTYCNAGHNPPIVAGASGVRRLETGGPVVGLLEMAPYDQETLQLAPGDRVVVFSDGVSEAFSREGEEFGDGRLVELVRAAGDVDAATLVKRIVGDVRAFTAGAPQSDDITVMVVRYLGAAK